VTSISIITVVRNDRSGLERTIASVREQTCDDVEFVVVDGASDDGTVDVIRAHADVVDDWVSEPDQGIYDAMNKGLQRARGEMVLFLNAGDALLTQASLESAVQAMEQHRGADILYFEAVRADARRASGCDHWAAIRYDSVGNHQALLVRTAAHRRFPFDLRYRIKADRDVQLRMFLAGCRAASIPLALVEFAPGGISSRAIARKEWENVRICWERRVGAGPTAWAVCRAAARITLFYGVTRPLRLDWDAVKSTVRKAVGKTRPERCASDPPAAAGG
jgi:glycosyltransferase involved in cell wall biosynthesis